MIHYLIDSKVAYQDYDKFEVLVGGEYEGKVGTLAAVGTENIYLKFDKPQMIGFKPDEIKRITPQPEPSERNP